MEIGSCSLNLSTYLNLESLYRSVMSKQADLFQITLHLGVGEPKLPNHSRSHAYMCVSLWACGLLAEPLICRQNQSLGLAGFLCMLQSWQQGCTKPDSVSSTEGKRPQEAMSKLYRQVTEADFPMKFLTYQDNLHLVSRHLLPLITPWEQRPPFFNLTCSRLIKKKKNQTMQHDIVQSPLMER